MRYWFNLIYKTQRSRVFMGVLLAFISSISGVGLLMLSGWFITATALAGISISAGLIIIFDMYMPGSGIRFFALSRTVGRYVERLYNHDTILRLVSIFRLSLFKRLSALSMKNLRATTDSEWLSRLTADLDALDSLFLKYTIPPIIAVMLIISASIFASFIWPELALYLGGALFVLTISAITLTIKFTRDLAIQIASLLNNMRSDVIEHLNGKLELQSRKLLHYHERHIMNRLQRLDVIQSQLNARVANIQLLLDFLIASVLCVLAITALNSVQASIIDGPVAVMLVLMFLAIAEALQILPSQFSTWGKTHYCAQRLKPEYESNQTSETCNTTQRPKADPTKCLTITVQDHPNIESSKIKPLEIVLKEHELLLISGRSGTGKSTLANMLTGITDCSDMTVGITSIMLNNSIKLSHLVDADWYLNIGYATQNNSVMAGTLRYNLSVGLDTISEEKLWAVLAMVELDAWAKKLKHGIETWLGETGDQVSGGQARRITLARLLLRDPHFVVLDEPFNGIDTIMAKRIWFNMSSWLNQRTVLLFSHERPAYFQSDITINHLNLD